jgi:hypothetical protein
VATDGPAVRQKPRPWNTPGAHRVSGEQLKISLGERSHRISHARPVDHALRSDNRSGWFPRPAVTLPPTVAGAVEVRAAVS